MLRFQWNVRNGANYNYIYLGGSLVAKDATPLNTGNHSFTSIHTDALGSPVAETNASRVVVKRNEFEPLVAAEPAAGGWSGVRGACERCCDGVELYAAALLRSRHREVLIRRSG